MNEIVAKLDTYASIVSTLSLVCLIILVIKSMQK